MIALAALALARPDSRSSIDSETHPLRCHWDATADLAQCAAVLGYAEAAWDAQVGTLGFRAPPSDGGEGGSDALDLYLGTSETGGAGEAWVDCDGGDPHCVDSDGADGLARASSYVVVDARTPAADMEGYVTHELNHTLQYGTDYAEPFLAVWEGTAVAAEVWTLGTADASQVADYQATPWLSAVLQDGYFLDEQYDIWSWYEYGAVTWVLWMDERYGGDGAIGPLLWETMSQEGYGDEPDVLDAWEEISGLPWETELREYALWRAALADGDDIGPWVGAASEAWREGTIDAAGEYTPEWPLFPMGMAVWEVEGFDNCGSSFEVSGDGRFDILYVREPAAAKYMVACTPIRAVAVVSFGPEDLDADDSLEAATFTLKVTGTPKNAIGCGCGSGAAPGMAPLLLALAAYRSRKIRSSPNRIPASATT
ncbi:MAG: hypothetical protein ACOZNI_25790 [Myxococcota bacterium]